MNYVVIGLAAVFIGMNSAHSQSSVQATPNGPVHPGTAILDSMGIDAGRSQSSVVAAPSGSVHPGTAILDSMGIFAGEPSPAAPQGTTTALKRADVAPISR